MSFIREILAAGTVGINQNAPITNADQLPGVAPNYGFQVLIGGSNIVDPVTSDTLLANTFYEWVAGAYAPYNNGAGSGDVVGPGGSVTHGLTSYASGTGKELEAISTIRVGANNTLTAANGSSFSLVTPAAAAPNDIALTSGNATAGNAVGGGFTSVLGNGFGSGKGGGFTLTTGAGGATNANAGDIIFQGGASTGSGQGGVVYLNSGVSPNGGDGASAYVTGATVAAAGGFFVNTGTATASNQTGGDVTWTLGNGHGTGRGGNLSFTTGNGIANNALGGNFTYTCGHGFGTGLGGGFTVFGGLDQTPNTTAASFAVGGGSPTQAGNFVYVAGSGIGNNAAGGSHQFTCGTPNGSGAIGFFNITTSDSVVRFLLNSTALTVTNSLTIAGTGSMLTIPVGGGIRLPVGNGTTGMTGTATLSGAGTVTVPSSDCDANTIVAAGGITATGAIRAVNNANGTFTITSTLGAVDAANTVWWILINPNT